jgi:proline iminopeptidase
MRNKLIVVVAVLTVTKIALAQNTTGDPHSQIQDVALRIGVIPADALNRSDASKKIGAARKIVTPNGIEKLEKIRIRGIDQWVSIRGTDKRNPVLLFIHGGPGYVSIPMSWWFSRGWEEYFTVVQWDQRASGKTYLLNDPKIIGPTLTLERMLADTEEMAQWVRKELGKKKIFVVGHSWGSYLGLELAKLHPDWIHAYIGVGQLTDGPESERRGYAFALNAAHKESNPEAIRQLEALAPYVTPGQRTPLKNIYTQRKWLGVYGGVMAYRKDSSAESDLGDLSPDYTDEEIAHIWDGNDFIESYLLPEVLSLDLTAIRTLNCPLIIFAGRRDYNVNSEVAEKWFVRVKAPSKQFVWFENSAHLPMTEEPGKFLMSLVRYVRPIAERAGDVPPSSVKTTHHPASVGSAER